VDALVWITALTAIVAALPVVVAQERPRARELGVDPGVLAPGPLNAITDVAGVRVGHRTIVRDDSIRTGVTAIIPADGNLFHDKVPAAVYVGNGFGKAAGFLQVSELGNIETPIILTNTLSVGTAVEAVVAWAIETAKSGPVLEGSVGAGAGTRALGWKGGIGTSSRVLPASLGGFTVGALVQSNFGGILAIDGIKVGESLGRYAYREHLEAASSEPGGGSEVRAAEYDAEKGSVMIVLATDAPLSPRNLERLAKRAILGLARAGSFMSNGSGDFVIAFSTRNRKPYAPETRSQRVEYLFNDAMSPLFLAAVESVEEAVYNSLLKATTMRGRDGHTAEAIPLDELRRLLR
jgi:D-aminopeptidase